MIKIDRYGLFIYPVRITTAKWYDYLEAKLRKKSPRWDFPEIEFDSRYRVIPFFNLRILIRK